jgi:hypothetical protein
MRLIKSLAAVSALVIAATPALASDWVPVFRTSDNTVTYYDADTIIRSGNQVTVWEKHDHSRNKSNKARETKIRIRYDCKERTLFFITASDYYPDGKIESFTYDSDEQAATAAVPDSRGEAMLEAVCGHEVSVH